MNIGLFEVVDELGRTGEELSDNILLSLEKAGLTIKEVYIDIDNSLEILD
jgi:hypothetical protein